MKNLLANTNTNPNPNLKIKSGVKGGLMALLLPAVQKVR